MCMPIARPATDLLLYDPKEAEVVARRLDKYMLRGVGTSWRSLRRSPYK